VRPNPGIDRTGPIGHIPNQVGHPARAKTLGLVMGGVITVLLAPVTAAWAHKPSDSTLVIQLGSHGAGRAPGGGGSDGKLPDPSVRTARRLGGWWDIAIRDLDDVLQIDADGNGEITWGELRAREPDIARYAFDRLALTSEEGNCGLAEADPFDLVRHSDGAYVSLLLSITCPASARTLTLDYRLLFEVDAQHRGLVRIDGAADVGGGGGEARAGANSADSTFVLSARDHRRSVALPVAPTTPGPASALAVPAAPPASSRLGRFGTFVADGVRHIWGGLDHILFLVALLLPAVVRRRDHTWVPVPAFRPALADVARIVTAFTIAHSLTLSLAALGLVQMPARLTEPAIAATVIVAAANNLFPVFGNDRWMVAFALGLLHGFGFSSVLADLGLTHGRLLVALFGFNLGVELGQLAVVATFVPLAFFFRRTVGYRRVALFGGSTVIALVAVAWFVARIIDLPRWS
jgi:hypothetical protein